MEETYDYIIVGAGSAGCVLAHRLTEDRSNRVLLLEAGGKDRNPMIQIPVGWTQIAYDAKYSWRYRTEPEPHLGGRRLDEPTGKLLGGSSSTNGMIYIRGHREDFDHWERLGNRAWGWEAVLPYFKLCEDQARGADDLHGVGGLLHVSDVQTSKISDVFRQACVADGIAPRADFNDGEQDGVSYYQVNVKRGRRHSTSTAYLKPARKRPNLQVVTGALCEQVLLEGDRALGIRYRRGDATREARAAKEVILAGGTINSPQLLQLSGIGPKALLESHGIAPQKHLPGVGENLQDHLGVMVAYEINQPLTMRAELRPHRALAHLFRYLAWGTGALNFPASQLGAFIRSSPERERPDLQLYFIPVSGYRDAEGRSILDKVPGVTCMIQPVLPESRGTVHIQSPDPAAHPAIRANYMSSDYDRACMLEAVKIQRRLFHTAPFDGYLREELRPGEAVQTDDEILEYVRNTASTGYHWVGTCKMGHDDMAVVDDQLRVHGIQRLRVVDASVMPTVVAGNTNAAAIMIAEKGADLILGREGPDPARD